MGKWTRHMLKKFLINAAAVVMLVAGIAVMSWGQGGGQQAGGSSAVSVTSVICNGLTITATGTCPEYFGKENCSLAASVASNILTVALKDGAGSDASATSPCRIGFRSATAATGSLTFNSVTAALSINTNATGATLGSSNSVPFRLWVVAFDNSGTTVLSLYNASTTSATAVSCFPIVEGIAQSSTTISGSATSAGVFYTPNGTTISSKSIRLLGYVEYGGSGLTTAGTYASGPTIIQAFNEGITRPCHSIRTVMVGTTSANQQTVSSTTYAAITGMSQALAPMSAANFVKAEISGSANGQALLNAGYVTLFRDSTQILSTQVRNGTAVTIVGSISGMTLDNPGTTSSVTYAVKIKGDGTNAIIFPVATDVSGSANNSQIILTEIMG